MVVPPSLVLSGTFFKRMERCGHPTYHFVDTATEEVVDLPYWCDNRACSICSRHKAWKFKHEHIAQMALVGLQDKTYPWLFSTPRLSYPLDRARCQSEMLRLVRLLDNHLVVPFGDYSIHMELQLNEDGWYLHFHVVARIINATRAHKAWGYFVRYDKKGVITLKRAKRGISRGSSKGKIMRQISKGFNYFTKYASKVPPAPTDELMVAYAKTVYKLQMHRFSAGPKDAEKLLDIVIAKSCSRYEFITTIGGLEFFERFLKQPDSYLFWLHKKGPPPSWDPQRTLDKYAGVIA